MGRRAWLGLLLALAVAGAGALLIAGRDGAQQGLAAVPALVDLAGVPDDQLLARVQAELSRRCAGDRARLPEPLRRLWVVEAGEGPLRQRGLGEAALLEASGAPATHRPTLAELAEAYRGLGLAAAAAVLDEAKRTAEREHAAVAAWAGGGRPARDPFAALDARLRAATAGSPAARIAWLRAHPDALAL